MLEKEVSQCPKLHILANLWARRLYFARAVGLKGTLFCCRFHQWKEEVMISMLLEQTPRCISDNREILICLRQGAAHAVTVITEITPTIGVVGLEPML